MTKTLEATFDGEVIRLDEPIDLEPNTPIMITIESRGKPIRKRRSFLRIAKSLNLEEPPDWSARFENYLYKNEQFF